MKIEYCDYVTRSMVQNNRHKLFLFGDNLARKGYGGQAKNMRGEPNSAGIPTKKYPGLDTTFHFFTDRELEYNCRAIDKALSDIRSRISMFGYGVIVIPKAGIGTGLARMQDFCPITFTYLQERLKEIEKWDFA